MVAPVVVVLMATVVPAATAPAAGLKVGVAVVVVLMVTDVPGATAPAGGLNDGVAAIVALEIVEAADATIDVVSPEAVATALMVVAAVMVMGAVYFTVVPVAEVWGCVPSMV